MTIKLLINIMRTKIHLITIMIAIEKYVLLRKNTEKGDDITTITNGKKKNIVNTNTMIKNKLHILTWMHIK